MTRPKSPVKSGKPKAAKAKAPKAKAVKKAARAVVRADEGATHTLAAHRDSPWVKAAGFISEVADQPPLIAASAGTLAIGLMSGRRDLARGGARMLFSHLLATGMKSLIKHQIDRTRPGTALDRGKTRFEPGKTGGHEDKSFPSGHTAGAVAVALAASHEIDGAAVPAALGAGAVAAAQAPAGRHYLTDVVVGGAVGWAAEAVVAAVFDRFEDTDPLPLAGEGWVTPASATPHRS